MPVDDSQATRTLVQTDAGVVMGTFTYMAPGAGCGGRDVDRARRHLGARRDSLRAGGRTAALQRRYAQRRDGSDPRARDRAARPAQSRASPTSCSASSPRRCAKDRAQRYQTITDLRLDLEALRSELQASSTGCRRPSRRPLRRRPRRRTPVRRESSAEYILTGLARHKASAAGGAVRDRSAGRRRAVADAPQAFRMYRLSSAPRVQRNLTRLTFGSGLADRSHAVS